MMITLLLTLLAPPALADLPGPDPACDVEVELLTLNAWGLPWPIAGNPRRARFPRINRFLEDNGFDVAGLQEVWRGALRLLDVAGLVHPPGGGDSGLAIVTPHPVHDLHITHFSAARGFDAWKSKGVLEGRVVLPEVGSLWVFNTHMQSGSGLASARVRAAQAEEILERIAAVQGPVVLLGDLNFNKGNPVDDETVERIREAGFKDVAERLGVTDGTFIGRKDRFDRVYVREGGGLGLQSREAEVIPYDEAFPLISDHFPVRVRVHAEAVDPVVCDAS